MRDDDVIVEVDEQAQTQRQNANEGDVQINESSFGTWVGHAGHTSRFNGESALAVSGLVWAVRAPCGCPHRGLPLVGSTDRRDQGDDCCDGCGDPTWGTSECCHDHHFFGAATVTTSITTGASRNRVTFTC